MAEATVLFGSAASGDHHPEESDLDFLADVERSKGGWLMVGMMAPNEQKARFSLSYIEAVASHAGLQVVETKVDHDSIDGVLIADFGQRPRIEFQAKATTRDVIRDSRIHFPLTVKNYDDLRIEAINPRVLIVLIMPKETHQWINQTGDELCLRHCAYWLSVKGEPATVNTHSITVQVPMTNVFDSNQLIGMMRRTESRGELC